jgi:hypothetical protein
VGFESFEDEDCVFFFAAEGAITPAWYLYARFKVNEDITSVPDSLPLVANPY